MVVLETTGAYIFKLAGLKMRAMSVVIETGRLRLRSHRDDDLGNLIGLAGNWERLDISTNDFARSAVQRGGTVYVSRQ